MIRKQWLSLIIYFLLVVSCQSHAAPVISINNLPPVVNIQLNPQNITGSSTITRDIDFCIVANNNRKKPKQMRFNIEVEGSTSKSEFLLHNGDNSVPIGFKMASYYSKRKVVSGLDNFEDLRPTQPGKFYTGALSCDGSDGNYGKSRLRITFNSSTLLSSLAAGTYTQLFTVKENLKGKTNTTTAPLTVNIIVPAMIQIKNLQDMSLPLTNPAVSFNGITFSYWRVKKFCVFINSGRFIIEAEGRNGGNRDFLLADGSHTVPYKVFLGKNLNSSREASPNTQYPVTMPVTNCDAQNNMIIAAGVTSDNASRTYAGNYSDTLTLLVEAR